MSLKSASLLGCVSTFAVATAALAQGGGAGPATTAGQADVSGLAEVIVTAQKRATDIEKTPIAITALDGAALTQQGKITLEEALRDVPGVTVQQEANGQTYTIRGIRPAFNTDPAVNVNRDGIFQSNAGVTPNFDVARVEILKGPQGTLYGRNAVGGVVNIVNAEPQFRNGGFGAVSLGDYDAIRAEGAVNVALSDRIASRTSVFYNKHKGYLSNGSDDDNSLGAREKLQLNLGDNLRIDATGEHAEVRGHGPGGVPAPLSAHANGDDYLTPFQVGYVRDKKDSLYGSVDYDLGAAVLTVIPSYYKIKLHSDTDVAGQGLQNQETDGAEKTQEVRLASPTGAPVQWQLGGYHLYYSEVSDQYAPFLGTGQRASAVFPTFNVIDRSVDSIAAFGQGTVTLAPGLRATLGARETRDRKKVLTNTYTKVGRNFVSGTPQLEVSQSATTWNGDLEYDLGPRSMVYAGVSKGYKSGGLNDYGSPAAYATYAPEVLYAYVAGIKNRFFDNKLQLNADLYYYDYSSKQFQAVQPRVGTFPLLITFNGRARVEGGEVQLDWQVTPTDRLGGSLALTDSLITDFNYTGFPSRQGQPLENAPHWSGGAQYEHIIPLGAESQLSGSATFHFQSGTDTITDVVTDDYQMAFQKIDLSLAYSNHRLGLVVSAYVNNLTDVTTRSRGFPSPNKAIIPDSLTLDPPRTFGVSVRKNF